MPNKTIYFLIDCSGSMYGARADAVNTAMEKIVNEVIPQVRLLKAADLDLYFMVLGFNDMLTDKVVEIVPKTSVDDFNQWPPIEQDFFNGGTPTGAAIERVIQDLQGGVRGEPDVNAVVPAIFLISDGEPNGSNPTYEEVMECAVKDSPKEVRAFRKAIRIAFAMNVTDDRAKESLKKFGSVSAKMAARGLQGYYECSDEYLDYFVDIIMTATMNVSVGNQPQ